MKLPAVELGDNVATIPIARFGSEDAGNQDCWITDWGVTTIGKYYKIISKITVYINHQ